MSSKAVSSLLLLLLFTGACTGLEHREGKGKAEVMLPVPFHPQDAYRCGPASLAEVLGYWGVEVTPREIEEEVFKPSLRGSLTMDMLLYPRKAGFKSSAYGGGMEDLRDRLRQGYPLVLLVDFGFFVVQKNHFMVAVGYNGEGIFAHSGREKARFFPYAQLERIWKRTGYWTLLIHP